MSTLRFDVVVVGAGLVGACVACSFAAKGFRVALIEAAESRENELTEDAVYDLRVSAISPRSREILEQLGIWRQLDPSRVCYYEQMFIWHEHGEASVAFDAVDLACDNLGAIVENRLLLRSLQQACGQHPQIEWFMPDRVETLLENTEQGIALRLASGSYLEAGLLIAADGRGSPTRELADIGAQAGEYRQTAFVANVTTEFAHAHTAWQRFLATGPLAFLPLANGQSSIVWSCDDDFAASLAAASDKQFCDALGEAFEYKLGEVSATSPRSSFALGWHDCERWFKNRVVLVGDAAHSVHPLAGQGVNLGFSDVELLVRLSSAAEGEFCQRMLRRYQRQRKSETWLASKSFSGLKWIYGLEQKPLATVRDLGMKIIEKTPWFKRALMQKAVQNIS